MMKRLPQTRHHPDGYLRLTLAELKAMRLVHLCSAQDPSVKGMLDSLCIPFRQAGYTEWWVPAIHLSIGWDWYVDGTTMQVRMAPWDVRSNVMLVTVEAMADLGAKASEYLLRQYLASLSWPQQLTVEMAHVAMPLTPVACAASAPVLH